MGRVIDLHSTIPISKVRLAAPPCEDHMMGQKILAFYESMCKRLKLLQNLLSISHDYWLYGVAYPFAEWNDTEKIWDRIVLFDPDHVVVDTVPFSDEVLVSLVPPPQVKAMIKKAETDERRRELVETIPEEIRNSLNEGIEIPVDTDPETGSFIHRLSRKADPSDEGGVSILERVQTILIYRDKLRQAQTQIASRAMTPRRIVSAVDLSQNQVDDLRDQIDMALMTPDYTIVTNYDVNWQEMGANDRLLQLQGEYEETETLLLTGLGITKDIVTGQASYSGSRISLEIINAEYMLYREIIQEYVEEYLFRPVALANGFVGKDKDGNEILLYPKLQFNRMSIRDTQDTFDNLFTLYQKGSLDIGTILDLFNIDPQDVRQKLEEDMGTVNDSKFNELLSSAYSSVGGALAEKTDLVERIAEYLQLKMKPNPEGGEAMPGGGGGGGMPPLMGGGGDMGGQMPPEVDMENTEGAEGAEPNLEGANPEEAAGTEEPITEAPPTAVEPPTGA